MADAYKNVFKALPSGCWGSGALPGEKQFRRCSEAGCADLKCTCCVVQTKMFVSAFADQTRQGGWMDDTQQDGGWR